MSDLIFIGDAHLERDDPQLPAFLSFLDHVGETCERVVLIGDLFNLWIGLPELEQPHQIAVLAKLTQLRRRGVTVRYVEGNRDYRIGARHAGAALDDVAEGGIVERHGGRRIWAIHGDLANPGDRQYRIWRRISRSRLFWGLFRLVPRARRRRLTESLELRMRSSNREFKRELPERAIRDYAAAFLERGHDAVVLGHFHVEKRIETERGPIFILPEWRSSRRHLRVDDAGKIDFVDSNG